jgi:serine/threonine protein kinase
VIGEGSFGKVFLGQRKEEPYDLVAIKVLDGRRMQQSPKLLQQVVSEIKVHWALERCDGMLGLQEIYEDANLIYLVLDYQESGTLLSRIGSNGPFSEFHAKVVLE